MALSALLRSTLSRAPLFAASRVLSSKVPDTSFLTDNYQSEVFKQGAEASISGQFAPYRPGQLKMGRRADCGGAGGLGIGTSIAVNLYMLQF